MPTAVVLTALGSECQAVLHHLRDRREVVEPTGTVYDEGHFDEWRIVVAEIGPGNENAAIETERALGFFKPEVALFVGIAGGLKDVQLGDVVVATKIYGYEYGKDAKRFLPRPEVGRSSHRLVQRARADARGDAWRRRLPAVSGTPKVFVQPIAAGSKVVAAGRARATKFLREHYSDAVAVEMEGFGFIAAAFARPNIQAAVIRGISDLIEGKAEADAAGSQERASRHAAGFAFEMLANLDLGTSTAREGQADEVAEGSPDDWGDFGIEDPPLVFRGRQEELRDLGDWVLGQRCRVVEISGLGGIGKSTLLQAWLQDPAVRQTFSIFSRNLFNPMPATQLLMEAVRHFSGQIGPIEGRDSRALVRQLLELLNRRRGLIILDNLESVLDDGRPGRIRSEYADLEHLFLRMAQAEHQSCLILATREGTRQVARIAALQSPVRSLELAGISLEEGRELFRSRGEFTAEDAEWGRLVDLYKGHPYALLLASEYIADAYSFDIAAFLREGVPMMDDLSELLAWHVQRLSPHEMEVVYWLAIARQPMRREELKEDLLTHESRSKVGATLQSLRRRIALEVLSDRFSLQPVMVEFMTLRLIEVVTKFLVEEVAAEILDYRLKVFNSHALSTTSSGEHVQTAQQSRIIAPILDRVGDCLPPPRSLRDQLLELLTALRRELKGRSGYAPGNLINMLNQLRVDMTGFDFSGLSIRQARLNELPLRDVDFTDCHFDHCLFLHTFGSIQSVAYSPDGESLAAGDTNGMVHVWNVRDSQLRLRGHGHDNWVRSVLFAGDGRSLFSASDDHTIRVWNLSTGRVDRILRGHRNWVRKLALDDSSRLLASVGDDGTVRIWDVASEEMPCLFSLDSGVGLRVADFHPRGHRIALGTADGQLVFLSLETRRLSAPIKAHDGALNALEYLGSGELLATAGDDGLLKLWDVSRQQVTASLAGHEEAILAMGVDRSGERVVTAGRDGTLKLWDCPRKTPIRTLEGHGDRVWSVAVAPDDRTILSGGDDQTIRMWSLPRGECVRRLKGHVTGVWSVAWSSEGDLLASGHDDHRARLWCAESGECLHTFEGHTRWVQGVCFHPHRKLLASASADGTVRLWDLESKRCLRIFEGHGHWVVSVSFSPDGNLLASAGRDETVRLWDPWSGDTLAVLEGHDLWVWAVRFSPCGRWLASGGEDGRIVLWDVASRTAAGVLEGHQGGIWCLSWSPDSRHLVSGGVDSFICLWEIGGRRLARRFQGHESWLGSLDFHPEGNRLASGGAETTVRIWDVDSGESELVLSGHESWVWSLSWSPDGHFLATGSQDETIRVWEPEAKRSRTLFVPRPYEGMILRRATGLTEHQRQLLKTLGAVD